MTFSQHPNIMSMMKAPKQQVVEENANIVLVVSLIIPVP